MGIQNMLLWEHSIQLTFLEKWFLREHIMSKKNHPLFKLCDFGQITSAFWASVSLLCKMDTPEPWGIWCEVYIKWYMYNTTLVVGTQYMLIEWKPESVNTDSVTVFILQVTKLRVKEVNCSNIS